MREQNQRKGVTNRRSYSDHVHVVTLPANLLGSKLLSKYVKVLIYSYQIVVLICTTDTHVEYVGQEGNSRFVLYMDMVMTSIHYV